MRSPSTWPAPMRACRAGDPDRRRLLSWQLEHGLTLLGRAATSAPPHLQHRDGFVWRAGKAGGVAAIAVAPRLEEPRPLIAALDVVVRGSARPPWTTCTARCRSTASCWPTPACALPRPWSRTTATPRAAILTCSYPNSPVAAQPSGDADHRSQRAESLAAAQDAVTFLRRLVTTDREAHLPLLASAVSTLSISLSELGRRAEGLATASEAGDLFQEIAASDRHAWPELIGPMNNLAIRLREAGHPAEALPLSQLTVAIRRLLAEIDRVLPRSGDVHVKFGWKSRGGWPATRSSGRRGGGRRA